MYPTRVVVTGTGLAVSASEPSTTQHATPPEANAMVSQEWRAGIGMVTPLGIGLNANWNSLLQGLSGVTQLLPTHLPAEHHLSEELASRVVGAVDDDQLEAAMAKVSSQSSVSIYVHAC